MLLLNNYEICRCIYKYLNLQDLQLHFKHFNRELIKVVSEGREIDTYKKHEKLKQFKMSKVDEDLNDSFSRMNTSKLSDEYDPLVAVFSSSATASTASNDEDDDSDEWEKHSIEKRRNRTLTPTRTLAINNMTFSPRIIKKDIFEGIRNLPFSRSNSLEDKQQLRSSVDKINSEDTV